jgi:phytoene synthase
MSKHRQGVSVELSYQLCRKIAKESGSNFYQGMWFTLDRHKREALFSIYAWMRAIDDIADGDLILEEKIKLLHDFFDQTEKLYTPSQSLKEDSFWLALQHTIQQYPIPLIYFREMFLGQIQSVQQNKYATFSELYQYCYRVASVVGLICIAIWGYEGGNTALKLAEYRGIALQLTNIIRDVQVDAQEGKLFIPGEWIERQEELEQALTKMIDQAEYYYHASQKLDKMVSRRGSLSLLLMTSSYAFLLNKMKKMPQEILKGNQIKLSRSEKLTVCITGIVKWCFAA